MRINGHITLGLKMLSQEEDLQEEFQSFIRRGRGKMNSFCMVEDEDAFIIYFVFTTAVEASITCYFVFHPGLKLNKIAHIYDDGEAHYFFDYEKGATTDDQIVETIERELSSVLIGFRHEMLAVHYFKKLSKRCPEIKNVRLSNKVEDKNKVDLFVETNFPNQLHYLVPIQIKSSLLNQLDHRKSSKGRRIPSMVVPNRHVFDQLAPRMLHLLSSYAVKHQVLHITPEESLLGVSL